MRKLLTVGLLLLLGACATAPKPVVAPPEATVVRPHFEIDDFVMIGVQYHAPNEVAGVSLYGPAHEELACTKAAAAFLAQAPQYMPKSDRVASTCLEVKFTGPVAGGQTVLQPFHGTAAAWAIVPIEYDNAGKLVGMGNRDRQPIPGGASTESCVARANEIRSDAYAAGVPHDNSLVIYCVGLPALPQLFAAPEGGDVMDRPCPWYPFAGAGPCQIEVRRELL